MTHSEAWTKVEKAVAAGDPEESLKAIAAWLDVDRAAQTNPEVVACLESAADGCRHAAMDYYVSTK